MIERKRGMNRKGAIHVYFLISIVILVLSAVVILFFYYQFHWKGTISDETCHQSALMRHSFNIGVLEIGREAIPLRCQVKKICLYSEKKDCDFPLKKNVKYIEIKGKSDKEIEENIARELANQMYDTWTTLGRGFLQIFHREDKWFWESSGKPGNCVVYSWIKFSEDLKGREINLSDFLYREIPGGEISYWDYFAGKGTELAEPKKTQIIDIRNTNLRKQYEKIDTSRDQWSIYFEADAGQKEKWQQFVKLQAIYDLLLEIETGEKPIVHSVLLLPLDIDALSILCTEFHEIPA